jgi:hypothetical protein
MAEQNVDRLTQRYRERVYLGRSRRKQNKAPSLEDAVEDAYNDAKKAGKPGPYRLVDIWVDGTNPLTEYIVVLATDEG